MPRVETTAGSVDVAELGRTLTHEHLFVLEEALRLQWPHAFDVDEYLQTSIANVRKLREFGVETICDPTCLGIGRDVQISLAVAEATGMRFVMATGIYDMWYRGWYIPWSLRTNPDRLVDFFVHDIEIGIQGTDVKAGFIKCVADEPGMVPDIVTMHQKVAEASLRTRTPIMAHSNPDAGLGLKQMKLFTAAGVNPAMVQIAHVADTEDLDYIERLLATGCYIGFDRYGTSELAGIGLSGRAPSTERRNATLLALLERGYGDRIMLSQDNSLHTNQAELCEDLRDWYPGYLFEHVLPRLREADVTEEQIDAMVGSNVHSWLIGAAPGTIGTIQAEQATTPA